MPARDVLAKKRAWNADMVATLFAEHGPDAPQVVAEITAELDLVGKPLAYKTVFHVLQHLLDNEGIDAAPLVPLLRRFVEAEPYDPDGMRQFALVRNHALRLLARRRDPAARECLARWLAAFPVPRDTEYAVSLAQIMAEAANRLGEPSLVGPLRALVDTLIPDHRPSERAVLLAPCRALLDRT